MKYLSDDGKQYETEKEALKADEEFALVKEKEESNKLELRKHKKELADKVKETEVSIEKAEKDYRRIRSEAAAAIRKVESEQKEKIRQALIEVDKARESKMLAIKEFNEEFGPYTKVLTDSEAAKEFNNIIKDFNNLFDWFF